MSQVQTVSLKPTQKQRFIDIVKRFAQTRLLVIGDFILDQYVWGSVRRISPEAPVPVVDVQRESYMPGGSLNVANNIRSLGGVVYPSGVVGRDLAGRMLLKAMKREGIDISGIVYDRMRPTSMKTRVIAHSQQVVRFDREKADDISKEDMKKLLNFAKSKISDIDAVIIEDYGKGVIQPVLLKAVIRLAKRLKKPILVDPKEKHFAYYSGVTAITPNRNEAYSGFENGLKRYHKEYSIEEVGRGLLKRLKLEAALVTLGEDGMALFEKSGKMTKIPTAAHEVYDVSGAGDTVIATFGLALATGAKMREAAMLSNLASGIVVGKLGTAAVTPDELIKEIEARVS